MSRGLHDKVESHVKTREPYDKTLFGIRGEFKHSQPQVGALCAPVFVTIFLIIILATYLWTDTQLKIDVKVTAVSVFLACSAIYGLLMAYLCRKGLHTSAYCMLIVPLFVALVFIVRKSARYSSNDSSKDCKGCTPSG